MGRIIAFHTFLLGLLTVALQIPERALLNAASRARVASDVAAFAVVPYILKQGLQRAMFAITAQASKLPQLVDSEEQKQEEKAKAGDALGKEPTEQGFGEVLLSTPFLPSLMSATPEPASAHEEEAMAGPKSAIDDDDVNEEAATDRQSIVTAPMTPGARRPAAEAAIVTAALGNSRRSSSSGSRIDGNSNSTINGDVDDARNANTADKGTSIEPKRTGGVSSPEQWDDDDFDDDDDELIPARVQRGRWK